MPTSSADPPARPAAAAPQATPGRPEPLLELRQLSAGYNGIPVIEGVTIGVGRAEVVAVIGPNGAGKSTLLKAVIGEIPALAGTVSLGGRDLARLRADRRTRLGIGYVPQTRDVFDALTVAENLKMGGYLLDKQELATQTQQVLEVFPVLAGMRDRIAGRLSGGERKMLAVARTLMLRPSLLILDEPSANLAPDLAKEVLAGHVRRLADTGMGVLLVEQKVFEALDVADWAHVLVAGHPRMEGRPADLLDRPDLRDVFLGAAAGPAAVEPAAVEPAAVEPAAPDPQEGRA